MTDLDRYRSAMTKVAPSEAWKTETLAKMAEARQAGQAGVPPAAPHLRHWRKAALPLAAAAAFALVAVPAALRAGLFSGGFSAAAPQFAAANDSAGTAAGGTAPSAPAEAPQAAPEAALEGAAPRAYSQDLAKTDGAGFELGRVDGLPVLVWGDEISGGSGGGVVYLAKTPGELKTANPTYNLAPESLPTELPVWYAQSGPDGGKALEELLQKAAGFLDLPLLAEETGTAPSGYPVPQLWPSSHSARLMDPALWQPELPLWEQLPGASLWRLGASGTELTLESIAAAGSDAAQHGDPAAARRGDDAALARFGALAGLETPAYQTPTVSYSHTGEAMYEWSSHFYYEAGQPADTISQKLFNYSFKRVYGSLDTGGGLQRVRLILPPATGVVATYPLRSLGQAKAALDARLEAELAEGARQDYPLSSGDVVAWELQYDQSPMNPYIQPVYVFTLKTPLTPEEACYSAFSGSEQYTCYVKYSVSALPEEYCVEWAQQFN